MTYFHFPRRVQLFLSLFLVIWAVGIVFSLFIPEEVTIFALHSLMSPLFDYYFSLVNYWPEPITIVIVAVVYLLLKPYRFLVLLINLIVIMPITFGFKSVFGKSRPVEELGADLALVLSRDLSFFAADSMSFPSGHSTSAFALAVFILYEPMIKHKGFSIGLFILAASAALSRVYWGHHYLVDILAGAFLGTILALIISGITEKMMSEKLKKWRWNHLDFS